MIRLLGLIFFAMILSAPAQAATSYRNFVWGVSPADVKKFESAINYDDKDGTLSFFEDTSVGRNVIRYDFRDDKLWRIRVGYQELHRPYINQILDIAADEQAKLTKKFGKPVNEKLVWKDLWYKRYAKLFERAFGMGKVTIESEWQNEDTNVVFRAYKGDPYYEVGYTLENRAAAAEAVQGLLPFTFNE